MPRPSSIRGILSREIKQAAPVHQHRDGPRHKESDLLMPSFDPMGAPAQLVLHAPQLPAFSRSVHGAAI
jgi:hypothetical protein